jgi:adenylyltransferase/sulfurtransferase
MLVDALAARVREIAFETDPACPLHGDRPTLFEVTPMPSGAGAAPPMPGGAAALPAGGLDDFLAANPGALVLDVREPHEAALGAAPRSLAMPASTFEARLHELDSARVYVVACRLGAKSRWAVSRLHDAGFRRLYHLDGGLLAYAAAQADFEAF